MTVFNDAQSSYKGFHMKIVSVGTSFPKYYYPQSEVTDFYLSKIWKNDSLDRHQLQKIHQNVQVSGRHFTLNLEEFSHVIGSLKQANQAWTTASQELGEQALAAAFRLTPLDSHQIKAMFSTTVTGIATPSLEALLINRLKLPRSIKRIPMFGLGCLGGVAGVSRVADYLKGWKEDMAVLLAVELCSLTVQPNDTSVVNMISTGLFGDGASALTAIGTNHPHYDLCDGPEIIATASILYDNTERLMGWEIVDSGFKLLLSPEVPYLIREKLRKNIDDFLQKNELSISDITSWICHPGGPKILRAVQETLELEDEKLHLTWKGLRQKGNLSSVSVLCTLKEMMENHRPPKETYGLMIAMGPAFCAEIILLKW